MFYKHVYSKLAILIFIETICFNFTNVQCLISRASKIKLVREHDNISIECITGKHFYLSTFVWQDNSAKHALRNDMQLTGDGRLILTRAQVSDTNLYKCIVTPYGKKINISETHVLFVYRVAYCMMEYPFSYRVKSCEWGNLKKNLILHKLCSHYRSLCPFSVELVCKTYGFPKVPTHNFYHYSNYDDDFLDKKLDNQLTIYVYLKPLQKFSPLTCNVKCLKLQYKQHFANIGSGLLKRFASSENSEAVKKHANGGVERLKFKAAPTMVARCDEGFELREGIICMPCQPGHFSNHLRPQQEITNDQLLCIQCQPGTFQNEYGSTFCKPCPFDTPLSSKGATSVSDCKERDPVRRAVWNWKLSTAVAITLLAVITLIFVCFLIVMLPCVNQDASEATPFISQTNNAFTANTTQESTLNNPV